MYLNNNLIPVCRTNSVQLDAGPVSMRQLEMQYRLLEGEANRAQQISASIEERGLQGPLTYAALEILRDVLPGTDEENEAQIQQWIEQHGYHVPQN